MIKRYDQVRIQN